MGPPNEASNADENGNSSPSGSGQSPATKRILVQLKAQISNLWVLPNCRRRKCDIQRSFAPKTPNFKGVKQVGESGARVACGARVASPPLP